MGVLWTVFRIVWEVGISASLLIIAVLISRIVLIHRLPKRTFSLLWTICAFRILVPVTLESQVNIRMLFRNQLLPDFITTTSLLNGAEDVLSGIELWSGWGTEGTDAAITGGTP